MMTAKQFEKTGSVINLQARKRSTIVKNVKMSKYPRKSYVRKIFTIDQQSKPDS